MCEYNIHYVLLFLCPYPTKSKRFPHIFINLFVVLFINSLIYAVNYKPISL
nr:MAG TPA: hypothetical protein [Caudoviricetes sp.]